MAAMIPEDVLNALENAFENNPESYGRACFFFDSIPPEEAEPYLGSLKRVVNKPALFKSVADRLVEDTQTAKKDPSFRQALFDIWNKYMTEDDQKQEGHGQTTSLARVPQSSLVVTHMNFGYAVSRLSPNHYDALMKFIDSWCRENSQVAIRAQGALVKARAGRAMVRVALVVAYLAFEVINNIRQWWKGEISGIRCAKNIIDCGVSVAAGIVCGVSGEIVGAMVGTVFGPVGAAAGALIGGVCGGFAASMGAQALSDKLTQWFFDIPKSEALENAYNFLGLKASASNSDINSAYRQLALQYHPDKGGDRDNWTKLQYSIQIIREARGES